MLCVAFALISQYIAFSSVFTSKKSRNMPLKIVKSEDAEYVNMALTAATQLSERTFASEESCI